MSAEYSDDRLSLAQEIAATLRERGHWVPRRIAGPDLIMAVGKALDSHRVPWSAMKYQPPFRFASGNDGPYLILDARGEVLTEDAVVALLNLLSPDYEDKP